MSTFSKVGPESWVMSKACAFAHGRQRTLLLPAHLSAEIHGNKTQLQSSKAAASSQVISSDSLLPG
uniref:Uncharacterized protein n=1 Tax=Sus scrofa TaxID=9823 RepID=A0A4X1W3P5_PIG